MKVDSDGEEVWRRAYGTNGAEYFSGIIRITDGGLAMAGRTDASGENQVYLVKTDSGGEEEWSGVYGDSSSAELAEDLAQLQDGSFVLVGRSEDDETIDGLVMRISAEGDLIWTRTIGERGQYHDERFHDVVVTPSGDIVVVGETNGSLEDAILIRLNPDGDVVWEKWFNLTRTWFDVEHLLITDDNCYLFTGRIGGGGPAVVKTEQDTIEKNAVVLHDPAVSPLFALNPPYPNPFNSSVRISYDLPASADVKLTIYDLSGRIISNLMDHVQDRGRYWIDWNAQDQPTGIYIARLQAGSDVESIKLLLVK